jgi:hypothetical protein
MSKPTHRNLVKMHNSRLTGFRRIPVEYRSSTGSAVPKHSCGSSRQQAQAQAQDTR